VADGIIQVIEESAIPVAMAGLLYALANTQLSRRLEREGRLHPGHDVVNSKGLLGDQCTSGLNFDTLRPRRDVLADYRAVVQRTYAPGAFFGRLRQAGLNLVMKPPGGRIAWSDLLRDLLRFARLALAFQCERPEVRREFWKTVGAIARKNPRALKPVVTISALYAHLGPFSQYVLGAIDQQIADVEAGRWQVPVPVPVRSAPGEMAETTTAR